MIRSNSTNNQSVKSQPSEAKLLSEAQPHQLLFEWNQTQSDYPQDKCIHHLFEEQVKQTPDAVAVVFEEQQLTYRQLNERANQLAHYLQQQGVKPEVLVGICIEPSLEMIVGLLAILKAGGAYVPLDSNYPAKRLEFMVNDAQVQVLLTKQTLLEKLPFTGINLVSIDHAWQDIQLQNRANPQSTTKSDNIAYVIYTSGSTGIPKGVAIPHKAVNRLVLNTNYIKIKSGDRLGQASNVSFDAATFEIWGALLNGASLMGIPKGILLSPPALASYLQKYQINILFITTALFNQIATVAPQTFKSLRYLLFGGEAVNPQWVRAILSSGAPENLIHVYGPTENTTFSSWYLIKQVGEEATNIPIGGPIANTQMYVLDQNLNPVSIGVSGELYLGGDGLARGYLNQPQLTAQKFISSPFNQEKSSKLYKTGDLVRYTSDGIEFLGRIDNQVKINGFRIELTEIETVLSQYPAVAQTVVITREEQPGNKRLVAYLVAKQEIANISELRSFLKTKLPDYMIPNAFIILEAMPLTANGKIDRQALPIPEAERPHLATIFVAPQKPIEIKLAQIWSEVLEIEPIGVNDNFFELGGNSLAATKILGRVRDEFRVELPFESLLHNLTIVESSKLIEQSQATQKQPVFSSIKTIAPQGDLPVSFPQEQVCFIQQLASDNLAYQTQILIKFQGQLNVELLKNCLSEIVQRHEILRTTFHLVDGKPVQRIHAEGQVNLSVLELEHLSKAEKQSEMERQIEKAVRYQFEPTQLPLIQWVLLKLSDSEYTLVHVEHHLIHDGWSLNIFLRELFLLYQAFSEGKSSPLSELPIQFADFAAWQRQWMEGEAAQAQLAYWQQKLAGCPPLLNLLGDRPRPSRPSYQGDLLKVELPLPLCHSLREMSHQAGMTLFMTMLTSFLILLNRYTAQEDICIGSGFANRRLPETEGLIGMFVNALPLRTDLSGNPTFFQLLERLRQVTLEAHTYQDLPLAKVIESLIPDRDLSYHPLFQVLFSFHDSQMPHLELPGLKGNVVLPLSNGSAKFDLNIIVVPHTEESKNGIIVAWEYNTDLFERETIERMAKHFQTLLAGIVANPEQNIGQLPLLTEAETSQLLGEWNNTQVDYPQDKCIHQLFEEQVAKTPEAVAIVFGDSQLTYQELNERANQLAHYLLTLGVTTETLVGICIERSWEMIVGLLAILKAGAAYVPLDYNYPRERIEFMIRDAQVPVLLTKQKLLKKLSFLKIKSICIDSAWQNIQLQNRKNLKSTINSDNLAYVIYTSGSTGIPKGVLISHSGLLNLIFWHQNTFEVTPLDRATHLAGIAFDASVWELWPYLAMGVTVYLIDLQSVLSPEKLRDWLISKQITITFVPTPVAEQLLSLEWPENIPLRIMLTGGDKLSKPLKSSLPFKLVNNYGPTENTVVTTSGVIVSDKLDNPKLHIGCPISNTQVYILDSQLQIVPINVPGELHISGVQLARGYLNRPELTAEKFISNPFANEPDSRLYKTGDKARYLSDGNIEFLGRIDHQVKIRGLRIELGEIETVLSEHPQINSVVVVVKKDKTETQQLVACVVGNKETIRASQLRDFLKRKLPDYMIPSAFVFLDALPLTAHGKIDRQALPQPDLEVNLETKFVAPRNQIETSLVKIWQEVLGIEKVGINDNFFRLGGHSLLATQVFSRISQTFAVELPLHYLFESPTIAELGEHLETLQWLQEDSEVTLDEDAEDAIEL